MTSGPRCSCPHHDLFGEVPVTWAEVEAWVRAVAGLEPTSWRWTYYVENWNVAEKIRRAKCEGWFLEAVGDA